VRPDFGEGLPGGLGGLPFALATGHPVADVDESLRLVPAGVANARPLDPGPVVSAVVCRPPLGRERLRSVPGAGT
jgi:hypothetical protein